MLEYFILTCVGICCVLTLQRWQTGIWLCVLVGLLQDPVRKLVPGEPVYMVVLCAVVFAAVILSLVIRRYSFSVHRVPGWRPVLSRALIVLMMIVLFQLVLAYINFNSVMVVMLGALTYFTPILAILAGFYFSCRAGESGVVRFMLFYCVICTVFTSGIYLEYLGFDWQVLGEVGPGLIIYDVGTKLKSYSGFFRSSEMAAWHIVLGSSFLLILATNSRYNSVRLLCVLGIVFLVSAGILTGRRKLIVSVVIFLTCYWFLITVYYRRSLRVAVVVVLLGLTAFWVTANEYYAADREGAVYDLYVERASGVFADITERGRNLGISAVVSAVRKHGLIGLGAGVAGQGARFAGGSVGYHYEAEGGLGKLVIELGLLGLFAVLFVLVAFSLYLWRVMQYVSARGGSYGYICYGMIAILLANLAHFTVASQVFSDPLVLILLGLFTGIIASGPVL
ncbi:MAG: hypothetical protein KTR33_00715, partial [Gammaproteobacteria bacterium]|nr:hypothetical protein [Gammaproteobacteria bacterium]